MVVSEIADGDDDASEDESEDGELNPYESTPTAIPAESFEKSARIVQVTAGDSASFALTDKGFVYGWGTFVVSNHQSMSGNQTDYIRRATRQTMAFTGTRARTKLSKNKRNQC